jgi:hypothetical protein
MLLLRDALVAAADHVNAGAILYRWAGVSIGVYTYNNRNRMVALLLVASGPGNP